MLHTKTEIMHFVMCTGIFVHLEKFTIVQEQTKIRYENIWTISNIKKILYKVLLLSLYI